MADPALEIAKVAIPTIIASIAAFFSVNLWTIKREKFELRTKKYELREKLQEDFQNYVVETIGSFSKIASEVSEKYRTNVRLEEGKAVFDWVIPDGEENLPKNLLASKFLEYRKNYKKLYKESWIFFSTLKVYFDSEEITKIDKLITDFDYRINSMVGLMEISEKSKELKKNYDLVVNNLDKLVDLASKLGGLLANTPLKKLPD